MSLRVRIRVDSRDVELAVDVRDGETMAVVGENGSGKSTLLESIAGLVQPDRGRIELDGRLLFERGGPASRATSVPAHRRATGLLTQDASLFPHLDVLDNVAFGPRSRGAARPEALRRAREALELVAAGDLARSRSIDVSGGEAQRIALARAIAVDPALLLLDEPFAAVDATARDGIRHALRRALSRRSALVVTHDVGDALALAERAVVLARGRVAQIGPVRDVFTRPQTPFAARLGRVTLVEGRVSRGVFTSDLGLALPRPDAGDGPMLAAFPPGALHVHVAPYGRGGVRGPGGADARLHAVESVEPQGALTRVRVAGIEADVVAATAPALAAGDLVEVTVDPEAVQVYPRRSPPQPEGQDLSILSG